MAAMTEDQWYAKIEKEFVRNRKAKEMLFTVMLTINFLEARCELPDSFDEQLVSGIREFFGDVANEEWHDVIRHGD